MVRLVDADKLKGALEKTSQTQGRPYYPNMAMSVIDRAPTIRAIPIAWINAQIGRMKVKGSPWVALALESLVKAWEQENGHE